MTNINRTEGTNNDLQWCDQNQVLSSFMTYHRVCNKSNTTGATCGAGTTYPCFFVDFAFRDLLFSILCFVDRYLSIWPLCRLSFCELRLLISSLVSSVFPHKTLRWKLKIEQQKIPPKTKVSVPLVASVVLLMLQTGDKLSTRSDYDKWNISAALEFTVIFRIFNNEYK